MDYLLNSKFNKTGRSIDYEVLNLIINGLPSKQSTYKEEVREFIS